MTDVSLENIRKVGIEYQLFIWFHNSNSAKLSKHDNQDN
jgi:hypothetical protein